MAVLEILVYPDSRLKEKSLPVEKLNDAVRAFINDLEETMRAGPGGVGIAAPQVGPRKAWSQETCLKEPKSRLLLAVHNLS